MTIKNLKEQLDFVLSTNYATENDEIVILGSGDRLSDFIDFGFCLPKVKLNKTFNSSPNGYYGLGILDRSF